MSTSQGKFWLAAVPLFCACAVVFSAAESPDRIKFPHGIHARAKVGCLTCHEEVYDAKVLDGDYRPKEAVCLTCHREKKTKGECSFCHTDVRRAGPYPRREHTTKMAHDQHIDKVKEDCARCHSSLPESGPRPERPSMAGCLSCHEHKNDYDQGRCEKCHQDLTRYPLKPVSGFSHQGNYVREHGRAARATAEGCAKCHEQTFCADCHASTVATRIELKYPEKLGSDFIHRDDFLSAHGIEARGDSATCRRCHGTSFCENCHTLQKLTSFHPDPRNSHPPGWMIPGSVQFHGLGARRDIASCAACHDQGPSTNCISCHRVGGVGGTPHPPSWVGQHNSQEIQRTPMCLYCHL